LRLGLGELKSGGAQRESILADTLEALVAALYLDSNLDNCRKIVLSWFSNRLTDVEREGIQDAKTRLQEFLQARHLPLPRYTLLATLGLPHERIFRIRCTIAGLKEFSEAEGNSRRRAEMEAATQMLAILENT
jgi:ribonuclease-3